MKITNKDNLKTLSHLMTVLQYGKIYLGLIIVINFWFKFSHAVLVISRNRSYVFFSLSFTSEYKKLAVFYIFS